MAETYFVQLKKECFVFSAAHFITFGDNICERLHGHNYKVAVVVEGMLGEHQYVIDFIALRDALRALTAELDHHVLLPKSHPHIRVTKEGNSVHATFEERRWLFPIEDCVILPVSNTTAEEIARYLTERLLEVLRKRSFEPVSLEMAVDECEGQEGVYRWRSGL